MTTTCSCCSCSWAKGGGGGARSGGGCGLPPLAGGGGGGGSAAAGDRRATSGLLRCWSRAASKEQGTPLHTVVPLVEGQAYSPGSQGGAMTRVRVVVAFRAGWAVLHTTNGICEAVGGQAVGMAHCVNCIQHAKRPANKHAKNRQARACQAALSRAACHVQGSMRPRSTCVPGSRCRLAARCRWCRRPGPCCRTAPVRSGRKGVDATSEWEGVEVRKVCPPHSWPARQNLQLPAQPMLR